MSIAFKALSAAASSSGASSATVNRPAGVSSGDLLIVAFAFEAVTAGPWVVPSSADEHAGPAEGWIRLCYQAPSASGFGLEVWGAIHNSGTFAIFDFTGSLAYVARTASYTGEYNPAGLITSGNPIRAATTAQVTGNNPNSPAVDNPVARDLLIVCAAHKTTGGMTAPSGFALRFDEKRSSFGNAEVALADTSVAVTGPAGPFAWGASTTSSPKGASATFAVQPAALPLVLGAAGINVRFKPA